MNRLSRWIRLRRRRSHLRSLPVRLGSTRTVAAYERRLGQRSNATSSDCIDTIRTREAGGPSRTEFRTGTRTSHVVRSSVNRSSSKPSNPSWSSTAPGRAAKRGASSSPLSTGTLISSRSAHSLLHGRRTFAPSPLRSVTINERHISPPGARSCARAETAVDPLRIARSSETEATQTEYKLDHSCHAARKFAVALVRIAEKLPTSLRPDNRTPIVSLNLVCRRRSGRLR